MLRQSILQIAAFIFFCAFGAWSADAEIQVGAIKKFRFPVQTYNLNGSLSDITLREADIPSPADVFVTGYWPDRKLLLIEVGGEAYYISFRAVEMNDQASWDQTMRATGNLICLPTATTTRGSQGSTTHATKGFASPC